MGKKKPFVPLLQNLTDTKYKEMWRLGERHIRADGSEPDARDCPVLRNMVSPLVHGAFIAIVEVLEFFSEMATEENTLCRDVARALNQANRDRLLFNLLDVPDD